MSAKGNTVNWVAYGSVFVLVLVAVSQLILNPKTEGRKRQAAWTTMLLLTALALLPVYDHFATTMIPRGTTNRLMFGLKFVAALSPVFGWILSISALIAAIAWWRSSRHAASSWALAAGIWASLLWTLNLLGEALAS
jgi:membrane protein YdbS with pleckstrin-like domain